MDHLIDKAPFNRKVALITGMALLIMAIAAGFSYGFVYSELVTLDHATTTFNKLKQCS